MCLVNLTILAYKNSATFLSKANKLSFINNVKTCLYVTTKTILQRLLTYTQTNTVYIYIVEIFNRVHKINGSVIM